MRSHSPTRWILSLLGLAVVAVGVVTSLRTTKRATSSSIRIQSPAWPIAAELPAESTPRFRRIVFVTIDTLRADHVSSYGYRRRTTPFIDSLAERGVLFERAIASMPLTSPSHVSMFTGIHPAEHRVSNGSSLTLEAVDAAKLFAGAGFDTAAFLNVRFLSAIAGNFDEVVPTQGHCSLVVDEALAYLESRDPAKPLFMWVHIYAPHKWLYETSTTDASREAVRGDGATGVRELYSYLARLHGMPDDRPGEPYTPRYERRVGNRTMTITSREDYIEYVDTYDALVRDADHQTARLYEAVQSQSSSSPTLWIVTSDHGEGLGSHGVPGHGNFVYQEVVHVPLIVHASDDSLVHGGPKRIAKTVQLVDLFPTLAETIGAKLEGLGQMSRGTSLWPLIEGTEGWSDRPAFSIRFSKPEHAEAGGRSTPEQFALQDRRYKLILDELGRAEFFDLELDPLELDGEAEDPHRAEVLRALLEEHIAFYSASRATIEPEEIEDEWLEELRDLGYVE